MGPSLLFLCFLIVWLAVGRRPGGGAVAIQYHPPQGLSPAALRYIRTTGGDGRTLEATIAQLAARGCIAIEPQNGKYKLTRLSAVDPTNLKPPLAAEETDLLATLFEDGATLVLDSKNGPQLSRYLFHISERVQKKLNNLYFTRNPPCLPLVTDASFLTAIGMAFAAQGRNSDRMTLLFLTWWFFFCFYVLGLIAVMTLLPALGRVLRGLDGAKELAVARAELAPFGGGCAAPRANTD